MLKLNHKNLQAWQLSIQFVSAIYKMTQQFPQIEMYGLTSQIRRAAISVPSNIAEGASRSSINERKRFYEIARSSLVEVDTQLEIAKNLAYISDPEISKIAQQINHIFAALSNLIRKT